MLLSVYSVLRTTELFSFSQSVSQRFNCLQVIVLSGYMEYKVNYCKCLCKCICVCVHVYTVHVCLSVVRSVLHSSKIPHKSTSTYNLQYVSGITNKLVKTKSVACWDERICVLYLLCFTKARACFFFFHYTPSYSDNIWYTSCVLCLL